MERVRSKPVYIPLPQRFAFSHYGDFSFNNTLALFDWTLKSEPVVIDLRRCNYANYQALSLLVLYIWHLRTQGCFVTVLKTKHEAYGASKMWRLMGANGLFQVLNSPSSNFWSHNYKPLFAIRNHEDFRVAVKKAQSYTRGFDVEYEKTLRYVLSELLYNTLEHGKNRDTPSLIQFVYYRDKQELSFIVADLGIGIRSHLRQAYPHLEGDAESIRFALNSQVSGTFASGTPYAAQNNAGVGLYLSSNIIRKLHAHMHIVSGRGVVHVSPTDITDRTIPFDWPGTFVNVRLELSVPAISLQKMMSEFRAAAQKELVQGEAAEGKAFFYLNVKNYFGSYAEDKDRAIKVRDRYLIAAIATNQGLQLDFEEVVSAPHSFLSALLAAPIRQLGMAAYKQIKVINAAPEIRETIDFILDENTAATGFTIVHPSPPNKGDSS